MAKILVVDDDSAVRNFVTRALTQCGHTALAAAEGDSALALLGRETGIALLISDVIMPGMDGVAVADAAKAKRPDLEVLLMTGYAPGHVRGDGTEGPAYRLITKPFSLTTICSVVDEVLGDDGEP